MTQAQLHDLENYVSSSAYSDQEKLVLRFAEEWTRQPKAQPETIRELSRQLSPAALVTLAATVGLANWTNRFNESFDVQLP